ncbi:MAG TPA: hypothetical protein VFB16_13700 [Bauldia sp.]|nr:hypothetical protein [Bauldia sp.]
MHRFVRLGLGFAFGIMGTSAGFAADAPPAKTSLWGAIEFSDIQATPVFNETVLSVLFDNFILDNLPGSPGLVERRLFAVNFPIKPEALPKVTGANADIRGHVELSEGGRALLIVIFGNQSMELRYPAKSDGSATSEDFLLRFPMVEKFASEPSFPMTILLVAQKPNADGQALMAVDSIDMALATK